MDWTQIMSLVVDNVLVPVLVVVGTVLSVFINSYLKKITSSLVARNEAETLEKIFSVKTHVVSELALIVEAAVASNMQLAESLKANGHKLDEDEIRRLNESARQMVVSALPAQMVNENESYISIMGGKEAVDSLIDSLMEKYVYEYKLKAMDPSFKPGATLKSYQKEGEKEKKIQKYQSMQNALLRNKSKKVN